MFGLNLSDSEAQALHYFPYDLSFIPFAKYSAEKNIKPKNNHQHERHIVLGDSEDESKFCEVFLNKYTTVPGSITSKLFNKDYGKSNADLIKIGISDAENVKSFLIDNKYILICNGCDYNVYNMMKDEWMLKTSILPRMRIPSNVENIESIKVRFTFDNARGVIINDQFLVMSRRNQLLFFPIWNKYYITHLDAIHVYDVKTGSHYMNHGLCCIDFDYSYSYGYNNDDNDDNNEEDEDDDDDKAAIENLIHHNLSFKLLLFGGSALGYCNYFCQSFLTLDISLDFYTKNNYKSYDCHDDDDVNDDLKSFKLTANENKIEIKCDQVAKDHFKETYLSNFAYDCILNGNGEAIIVIMGGQRWVKLKRRRGDGKFLCLYNTITRQLDVHREVWYTYTSIIANVLICLYFEMS